MALANSHFPIQTGEADVCGGLAWKPSLWIGHVLLSQLAKRKEESKF